MKLTVVVILMLWYAVTVFHSIPKHAAEHSHFTGIVTRVHDGDTFTIFSPNTRSRSIRVAYIDCPELDQPGGPEATLMARSLLLGRGVDLYQTGRSYNRTVAIVELGHSRSLANELVGSGMCMVDPRYNRSEALVTVQNRAKNKHLGIWKRGNPTPPWIWRRNGRQASKNQGIQ